MSRFAKKLSLLFGRDRYRSELDEEMTFHREQKEKELIAGGILPEAARYEALRQFGNATQLKERSHEQVGFRFETVAQDLRFALRQLRKNPGFAATAILILALGIASSVAIFAFVDAALIKPLPYWNPTRLAVLFESIPLGPRFHLSYPDYIDWKRENKVFSALDVYTTWGMMLTTPSGLQRVEGASVSDGFFRTLGVSPALGRSFYAGEDDPKAPAAVMLTYAGWMNRFGGRRDIVGQAVTLDGQAHTIVGVLPRDFSFAPTEPAEFWRVLKPTDGCGLSRGCHMLFGIARLEDGVAFATAFADVTAIAQQLEKQFPDSNRDQAAFMLPLTDVIVGDIRPILLVVLCGAGLLLLIASANVASLLLARSESRKREMAVRGALGASPRRLMRQFITEGLLLAVFSGALGVACAERGMRILDGLIPKDMMAAMPYLQGLGLNGRVAAFACVLVVLAGALLAFTPMTRLKFSLLHRGLSEGGRGAAGVVWRRFGANLVVIELATAMVLLSGAGLLGKSFYRLLHTDVGIDPGHVATLRVQTDSAKFTKNEQRVAFAREVVRQLQNLLGVKSVGITSKLPIEDGDMTASFRIAGKPYHGEHWDAAVRSVSSGYMTTLETRLLGGRYFTEDDDASKPKVVIVNQALAKLYFPREDPVGRQLCFGDAGKDCSLIVGEIADIQEAQLDAAPRAAFYRPLNQYPDDGFAVLVRTSQDEQTIYPAITTALRAVDRGMAIYNPTTLQQKIHDAPSTYLHRSSAWLVGGFAVMALLLGVVGLYGVIAYSVSQRTREIGVRMALGAERGNVYRLILREAGILIAAGIVLGLGGAIASAMLMRKLLFGVQAWDAPTLAAVALLLTAFALLASYLPARRAASVSPAEALRAE